MNPIIWEKGDKTHVALSPQEGLEIAQALLRATTEYPACEFEVRFTEENGTLKWVVKYIAPPPDASDKQP